jgi:hypothetical protein
MEVICERKLQKWSRLRTDKQNIRSGVSAKGNIPSVCPSKGCASSFHTACGGEAPSGTTACKNTEYRGRGYRNGDRYELQLAGDTGNHGFSPGVSVVLPTAFKVVNPISGVAL